MFVSKKGAAGASGFVVPPKAAGIAVVVGVMAVPEIPAAYLTPVAVFLGATMVFLMERRRCRLARGEQQGEASDPDVPGARARK